MNELYDWLKSVGFPDYSPALDGKPDRFARGDTKKKNAWFWGIQLHTSMSGETLYIARVGDWKTGEVYDFKSSVKLGKEDRAAVAQKIKEGEAGVAKVLEQRNREAQEEAVSLLSGAQASGHTGYLEKKGIPELYGARIGTGKRLDKYLAIPMRDVNGTLWGLQRIYDNGGKFYLTGQRVRGCFHQIPEDSKIQGQPVIYICEGFATGAAIYRATKKMTVIAFDAGNLKSVAQAIRKEAPEVPIVICGDEDQWRPETGNPGREKAEEAAKAVLGEAVFPRFKDESAKPTDFEDLARAEGLDTVRGQIETVKPLRHFIRCLGHDGNGTYYYTSSENLAITSISSHSDLKLLNLQKAAYYETMYPGKRGIDWIAVADDLMSECRKRGIFTPDKIRGLGVWLDRGRLVIHLGDRLLVDGNECGIHDLDSRFAYRLSRACKSLHPRPLLLEECAPILNVLNFAHLDRPEQKIFFGGWVVAAQLSGMLAWRPHIWITGESGSGKSTFVNDFLKPLLGDHLLRFTGGTTEAGMRNEVGRNSMPVVYDEFEPDSPEGAQTVKNCLQFIRQASTDSGDIAKGAMGGGSVRFSARFCAALSSIKTSLTTQADHSRFTLIELKKIKKSATQWPMMKGYLNQITPEFSERLFARVIQMAPVYNRNVLAVERVFAAKHSQRFGQQYGPLLAGWGILIRDEELTDEEIAELSSWVDLSAEAGSGEESDQEACLSYLLGKSVRIMNEDNRAEDLSMATLIDRALNHPRETSLYKNELLRYGIGIVTYRGDGKTYLFVAGKNPQLSEQIFNRTEWLHGWTGSLGRISGAVKGHAAYLNGRTTRGTLLPLDSINSAQNKPPLP
jgi:putative DNA primase/helicase